jgi:hypothetical protein
MGTPDGADPSTDSAGSGRVWGEHGTSSSGFASWVVDTTLVSMEGTGVRERCLSRLLGRPPRAFSRSEIRP